jgi:hypothetical protein
MPGWAALPAGGRSPEGSHPSHSWRHYLSISSSSSSTQTIYPAPTPPLHLSTHPTPQRSPYYSFAGGVAILMVTVMLLGVLATNGAPRRVYSRRHMESPAGPGGVAVPCAGCSRLPACQRGAWCGTVCAHGCFNAPCTTHYTGPSITWNCTALCS